MGWRTHFLHMAANYRLKQLFNNRNIWNFINDFSSNYFWHLWKSEYMSRLMTKPTKWSVHPAKTQISLGIRPVWSESSLCAQWVAKDPSFLHADSEDSDQTGRMPRLIWVFAGRICHFVGFVMRRLICCLSVENLQRSFFTHSWSGPWAIRPIVPILHYTLQIKKPKHFYSYGQDYNFHHAQCYVSTPAFIRQTWFPNLQKRILTGCYAKFYTYDCGNSIIKGILL